MKNSINYFRCVFLLLLLVVSSENLLAQEGVSISEDPSHQPDNSAILDVESTTKGVLVPRMTTADRNNIAVLIAPDPVADGLIIYNTDNDQFEYFDQDYNGGIGGWRPIGGNDGDWDATGNSPHMFNLNTGNVGIGNPSPQAKLDVNGEAIIRTLNNGNTLNNIVVADTDGKLFIRDASTLSSGTGADNDWIVSGNDMKSGVSGNIGVGTSAAFGAKMYVLSGNNPSVRSAGVFRVDASGYTTNPGPSNALVGVIYGAIGQTTSIKAQTYGRDATGKSWGIESVFAGEYWEGIGIEADLTGGVYHNQTIGVSSLVGTASGYESPRNYGVYTIVRGSNITVNSNFGGLFQANAGTTTLNNRGLYVQSTGSTTVDKNYGMEIVMSGNANTHYGIRIGQSGTGNNVGAYINSGSTGKAIIIPSTGGNVGIGTETPTAKVDVNGSMRLRVSSQPASPSVGEIYFDGQDLHIYTNSGWKVITSSL